MAARRPMARRAGNDIDVDDELQQLLKEQETFMRQSQRPAAKITRVGPPQVTPVVEKNVSEAEEHKHSDDADEMEEGPQVVGHVQERDVIQLTETNRILQPRTTAGGFPAVRRRGESLFGRRNRQQQPAPASEPGKLSGNGQIVERAPVVASASQAKASTSAPQKKRSDVVSDQEWDEIDQTNAAALRNMSTADIREAQQELLRMLDPELVAKLKNRTKASKTSNPGAPRKTETINPPASETQSKTQGTTGTPVASKRMDVVNATKALVAAGIDLSKIETEEELFAQAQRLPAEERAKHAWMQPLNPSVDSPNSDPSASKPASKKRHPVRQTQSKKPASPASTERFDFSGDHVATDASVPIHTGLYHHGDNPEAAGYTMNELLHLARSTVASQRAVALTTISKILKKRPSQPANERLPRVLPKELPVALRMTLDDQNYTALSAAITALHAFLCPVETLGKTEDFESARGTVVATPAIHLHVDVGATKDEMLHEVVYIDTSESPEDGGSIGDQELSSLDPVQGLLKMEIVARLSYILTTIQLPDADAMDKLLEILIRIAGHSPRAAQAVAADAKLLKALQTKYLENELVLTLQTEQEDAFTRAVAHTHKTLVLMRVLSQANREVATLLIERGVIQSTKGFLALRGDLVASENPLENVQLESLRVWRVLLSYGVDFHCFAYMYPLLCGFDGVNLVQDKPEASTGVKKWSDRNLAAVFAALEAFARLDTIHEAQHYFNQFGFFIKLAAEELFRRLPLLSTHEQPDVVVTASLRFLSVCCPLVTKFHLHRVSFHAILKQLQTQLSTSTWRRQLAASPRGRELVVLMMAFAGQVLQHDLLNDDEDDEEVRAQFFQQIKPVVLNAIAASDSRLDSALHTCELLLYVTDLFVRVDHHDDEFIRLIYATALQVVQDLKPGHQFWLHSLFAGVLFHPVVLQKTGFFPDTNDATTMSRILIPIYQALVNSTKDQEEHSQTLFAPRTNAKQKRTCHLVEPQEEQTFIGSNLPLPFFWMFCPFSRLEYTPPTNAAEEQKLKHAATTLGPSHAQADEMKVIVSAACRYLDQLETNLGGAVRSSSVPASQSSALGDEDKLFHLMHVFFAGADVLFDEYVDLALAKLLQKYATSVLTNANPTALYDGMLRNLLQFESIEAAEVREPAKSEDGAPKTSFTSETETVMTFVEKLVNEFTSSSFGNTHFARLVTLFLLHDFPIEIRKWVWKELADSHLLHRIEPFHGSDAREHTGCRATRTAKKSDETLIRAMAHAVANRKQGVVSHERGPFAYWLAIHHIVAYLFGDDDPAGVQELSFARQKLLQDLTLNASPVVWQHVLSYDASEFAATPHAALKQQRVDRVLQRGGLSEAQATVVREVVTTSTVV